MEASGLSCPLCSSSWQHSITPHLHRCRSCGIAYNSNHRVLSYGPEYFTSDYSNQYGRTYAEDHENIYRMSQSRITEIMRHANRPGLSVLDIGSALGFFLECARDNGAGRVMGVEISRYAADYAKKELSVDTLSGSFDEVDIAETFDVVSAWYFLEHCPDPLAVLKRIYGILGPGGVFAFSAPSVFGPLFLFHRDEWVQTHPVDHRIDFTPKGAVRVLKKIGFTNVTVRSAGVHPERMLRKDHPLYRPFAFIYRKLAPLFAFGDTIEVYAVK